MSKKKVTSKEHNDELELAERVFCNLIVNFYKEAKQKSSAPNFKGASQVALQSAKVFYETVLEG